MRRDAQARVSSDRAILARVEVAEHAGSVPPLPDRVAYQRATYRGDRGENTTTFGRSCCRPLWNDGALRPLNNPLLGTAQEGTRGRGRLQIDPRCRRNVIVAAMQRLSDFTAVAHAGPSVSPYGRKHAEPKGHAEAGGVEDM